MAKEKLITESARPNCKSGGIEAITTTAKHQPCGNSGSSASSAPKTILFASYNYVSLNPGREAPNADAVNLPLL
jgi:hypothetical protein